MKPIWIVDDDQSIRFVLERALLREDMPTRSFSSPREVLQALETGGVDQQPQVLVSDIRMPGGSGLDLLSRIKTLMPGLPVIIMTAFSDLDSAVSAFQGGAFEYLPKPFDLPKAVELIRRAVEESQHEQVGTIGAAAAPEMLGQAPAMQDVFRAIGRLSQSHVTVMITGESGSGKSTLARGIVGVWPLLRGDVRLDGAALDQWKHEILGSHIGYLPQDIELFDGTIAENIARFDDNATSDQIVAAAQAAGVHDMILHLEKGYETRIGESGGSLSAGQRQRIGLARALFGNPFLVVLDEPNSNLDSAGDTALSGAIKEVRDRGGIVIVIAHRPSALANVDKVMAMADGKVQAFGPKEEVLRKVLAAVPSGPVTKGSNMPAQPEVNRVLRAVQTREERSEVI